MSSSPSPCSNGGQQLCVLPVQEIKGAKAQPEEVHTPLSKDLVLFQHRAEPDPLSECHHEKKRKRQRRKRRFAVKKVGLTSIRNGAMQKFLENALIFVLLLIIYFPGVFGIKTCKQTFTIDGIFQMPILVANSSMVNTHLSVIDVCPGKTFCYGSLFVCFTNESSMAFYFTEKNFGPCYISYGVNYESNEKALEFSNKDCGERFANNPEAYGPMTASVTTITIPAEPSKNVTTIKIPAGPSENGLGKSEIVLIAVFVSIGLTVLIGVIYFCCRRRCRKKPRTSDSNGRCRKKARTSDSNGRTPTPLDQTGSPADVDGKLLNNSEEMPKGHDANEPLQDTEV